MVKNGLTEIQQFAAVIHETLYQPKRFSTNPNCSKWQTKSLPNFGLRIHTVEITVSTSYSYMRPSVGLLNSTCKTRNKRDDTHPGDFFLLTIGCVTAILANSLHALKPHVGGGGEWGVPYHPGKSLGTQKKHNESWRYQQKLHSESLLKVPLPPLYSLGSKPWELRKKTSKINLSNLDLPNGVNSMGPLGLNLHLWQKVLGAGCNFPHRKCAASLMNKNNARNFMDNKITKFLMYFLYRDILSYSSPINIILPFWASFLSSSILGWS